MAFNLSNAGVLVGTVLGSTLAALSPVSAEEAHLLGELVITSTGEGTERAKHPSNITSIPSADIEIVAADHPSEIVNRAPGVFVHRGSGQEHLTAIRSPVLTGGAGAGSFLYLEDGVPFRAPGFANVNGLFDAMSETAGSIEIVRGPASARFGSNAVHGLINFLSEAPTKEPEGEARAWAGPHGLRHFVGTASAGQDNYAARANLVLAEDDGYRANSGFGQQKFQMRYDQDWGSDNIRLIFAGQNLNQETAGFVVGNDAYKVDALRKTNPNPDAFRDAWSARMALRWERALANGDELAVTPYARINDMDFLMHFQPGRALEENGHWSTGVQSSYFMNLAGGHQVIFGTDVEYTQGYLKEFQTNPTTFGVFVQGAHYDYDVEAIIVAPYVQSSWALSDATTLTAGARLEHTRYDYVNNLANNTVGRFQRAPNRVDTFTDITPKLGIAHAFSDNFTGFANLARGARAPQTTDLYRLRNLQVPGQVESEKTDSAEIGARGFAHGIDFEIAAYYMEKSNFYFRDADGFNVPNGETKHYGVELEAYRDLGAGFDIGLSATYAVHKYAFDRVVASATASSSILSGFDIDTAPRTLANARLGYNFHEGRGRAELEWVHVGDYAMDPGNTSTYEGHDVLNIRARYDVSEQLGLYARITNLTDTRYADRADINAASGTPVERFFPGEERGVHIGASVRF